VNYTKTYLEPVLPSSSKKGIDFVNSGTVSNRKLRLPPSIKKGSKDLKLKKRKNKKNKSIQHKLSHNVSTISKSVKVFRLLERNESSQESTTKPSIPRNRSRKKRTKRMTSSTVTPTTKANKATNDTNEALKKLWKSKTVMVRYLPNDTDKKPDNYNLHDVMMDIKKKQKLKALKLTPPIVVAWVYHLARSITEVFERHGIHYSIEGGTAIGALRHHGLIPWDDDLDIGVLEEDEDKLLGPVSEDLKQNYSITWTKDYSADYKFFGISDQNSAVLDYMKEENYRYPFADIFIYVYNQTQNKFRYRNIWGKWIKAGIRSMDLSGGTKLVPFGDFKTRMSVDMIEYLNESGYQNWKYIGVTQWYSHVNNYAQTEHNFQLIPRLYAPARPFRMDPSWKNLITQNTSDGESSALGHGTE